MVRSSLKRLGAHAMAYESSIVRIGVTHYHQRADFYDNRCFNLESDKSIYYAYATQSSTSEAI